MTTLDEPTVQLAPVGGGVDQSDDWATPAPQKRRKLGGLRGGSVFNLVGAAVAGTSVSLLLEHLTALSGPFGLIAVGYLAFLVIYGVLVSRTDDGPVVRDALFTVLMATCAVISFGALGTVVFFTLARGWAALVHLNFYTQDMSRAGPLAPLTTGGMGAALVGTLWMVGIAVVLTVPIGLLGAVYLDVTRSRPSRFFRTVVEAMTALPSILAGLFIYAAWILEFGFGRSGLAAALALSVMMLPYIIRAADLALRLVPNNLREASAALGAPGWRGEWQVVIPTARSGLATAVILGIARAVGEASPVLLTAGFTSYMNADPLHGSMVSLPLETLKLVQTGVPNYATRAFGCAAFLLVLVIVLFLVARKIGGWGPGHLTPRGQRRVKRASARDMERFAHREDRSVRQRSIETRTQGPDTIGPAGLEGLS
jgi:phosphate transport system permease protein